MADLGTSEIEVPPREPRLRVVTMNVYGPANPDWDRRHRLIARTLRELDSDVVALQEGPTGPKMSTILGPSYYPPAFSGSSEDGVGGTLSTRWPHGVATRGGQHLTAGPPRGAALGAHHS